MLLVWEHLLNAILRHTAWQTTVKMNLKVFGKISLDEMQPEANVLVWKFISNNPPSQVHRHYTDLSPCLLHFNCKLYLPYFRLYPVNMIEIGGLFKECGMQYVVNRIYNIWLIHSNDILRSPWLSTYWSEPWHLLTELTSNTYTSLISAETKKPWSACWLPEGLVGS